MDYILGTEKELGDAGIVCLDIRKPLCDVAQYFEMGEYIVTALTEPELFHRVLGLVAILPILKVSFKDWF